MGKVTIEGESDTWRGTWQLEGDVTIEGERDDWMGTWRLKGKVTIEGERDDWRGNGRNGRGKFIARIMTVMSRDSRCTRRPSVTFGPYISKHKEAT